MAGVSNMLMTEFNIDIAEEVWREEGRREGREEAYAEACDMYEKQLADKDAEIEKLTAIVNESRSD